MRLSVVGGSLAKLERLGKDLGHDRAILFLRGLSHDLANESLLMVKEGFATSSGPDGRRWPKGKKGSGRPGIESGHLANSWRARSSIYAAEVYSTSPYARALHYGTLHIKPHPMIPTRQLPRRWRERLAGVWWRNVQNLLRGAR